MKEKQNRTMFRHESEFASFKKRKIVDESISNLTKVSITMAKHLFSKEEYKEKNIVLSPLSLYTILSIVAAGSDGPTQHQLLDFLQSESIDQLKSLSSQLVSYILADASPSGGPLLSFVNGGWIEQSLSLQPSFKQIVATDFKATLASVDFKTKAEEVRKEVNLWAKKETNGLIKNLLPPGSVDGLTKLIFACVFDGFKVLRLFYKRGESLYMHDDRRYFSIYIFLPDAKDGLLALTEKVASESEFLKHTCPEETVRVGDFRIPRFNVSFGLQTSDMLKELGVVLPFSEGAGLTKMVDSPIDQDLYVSEIYHKSFIEVNEKGTEAAAATSIGMRVTCSRYIKPPFLFFI